MSTFSTFLSQLKRHEGFRSNPYKDSVGVLTIGFGTNLEKGITEYQAEILMIEDLSKGREELYHNINGWENLSEVRQMVLLNMWYNLGLSRLLGFKNMLKAIHERDYNKASVEMLDSKWANQVGQRANELAKQMKTGQWE